MINDNENNYLPINLLRFINHREDVKLKRFLNENNERDLIKWLIKNGFTLFPELFNDKDILSWLSYKSNVKGYEETPRIILAVWDIHPKHRMVWTHPNDKEYINWLKYNWYNLKIRLPSYEKFFNQSIFSIFFLINIILKTLNSNLFLNLLIQSKAINAIIYREIKLRAAKTKLGNWSLFADSLAIVVIFFIIGLFLNRRSGSIDFIIFFSIGILYVSLFRKISIVPNNSLRDYQAYSIFPQIKPLDIFLAIAILENFIFFILIIGFLSLSYIINQKFILDNIATFLGSYLILVLFSFSCCLIFRMITYVIPSFPKVLIWFSRVIFITSCAIFPFNALPQKIRPFLSWNPILQAIEISRSSIDRNYLINSNEISFNYLILFTLTTLFFTISIYAFSEKSLLKR